MQFSKVVKMGELLPLLWLLGLARIVAKQLILTIARDIDVGVEFNLGL